MDSEPKRPQESSLSGFLLRQKRNMLIKLLDQLAGTNDPNRQAPLTKMIAKLKIEIGELADQDKK